MPGTGEIIWAGAEPRFHSVDSRTHFSGLHFVAMAPKHERLIRDYVSRNAASAGGVLSRAVNQARVLGRHAHEVQPGKVGP